MGSIHKQKIAMLLIEDKALTKITEELEKFYDNETAILDQKSSALYKEEQKICEQCIVTHNNLDDTYYDDIKKLQQKGYPKNPCEHCFIDSVDDTNIIMFKDIDDFNEFPPIIKD